MLHRLSETWIQTIQCLNTVDYRFNNLCCSYVNSEAWVGLSVVAVCDSIIVIQCDTSIPWVKA